LRLQQWQAAIVRTDCSGTLQMLAGFLSLSGAGEFLSQRDVRIGIARTAAERLAVSSNRPGPIAGPRSRVPEIRMSLGKVRLQSGCLFQDRRGILPTFLAQQRDAE